MWPEAVSGLESFSTLVAGNNNSLQMVSFDVVFYVYIDSNDIRHNYRLQNWSIGKLEKVVDGWTLQILEAIAAIDVDCHPELCCLMLHWW